MVLQKGTVILGCINRDISPIMMEVTILLNSSRSDYTWRLVWAPCFKRGVLGNCILSKEGKEFKICLLGNRNFELEKRRFRVEGQKNFIQIPEVLRGEIYSG